VFGKEQQESCTHATGFTISTGVILTAAHVVHLDLDVRKPIHTTIQAVRSPDIGRRMEQARFLAEDIVRDIALLRILNPRSNSHVVLESKKVQIGTICGSLGFPFSTVEFIETRKKFNLIERFIGGYVSTYTHDTIEGRTIYYYEIDSILYSGSSGCPGFLTNGNVIGMHVKTRIERKPPEKRLSISMWVPSMDIIKFAVDNKIPIIENSTHTEV